MATNIRGHHVVMPGFTVEYDRISRTRPFAIFVAAVILASLGSLAAIGAGLGDAALASLLLLSFTVGATGIGSAVRLATRNTERVEVITRDLTALRDVVVFDEQAASDRGAWDAAGIAIELQDLEDHTARLASARIRTARQEQELADSQNRMHEMTMRISALVL